MKSHIVSFLAKSTVFGSFPIIMFVPRSFAAPRDSTRRISRAYVGARARIEEDEFEKCRAHLSLIETLGKRDEDDEEFKKETWKLLEEIRAK